MELQVSDLFPSVVQLRELTESQIEAAKKLDGESLQKLNGLRSDLLFQLRVALDEIPFEESDVDDDFRKELRNLRTAEERLAAIAGTIVETIDVLSPIGPTQTYGRSGRLQG